MRALLLAALTATAALASPGAESCRVCHLDIYNEWRESWHARSTQNKNFTIAFDRWTKEGNAASACLSCHAPASIFDTPAPRPPGLIVRTHRGGRAIETHGGDELVTLHAAPVGPGGGGDPIARHRAWNDRKALSDPLAEPASRVRIDTGRREDQLASMLRQPRPRSDRLGEGVNCQSCHLTVEPVARPGADVAWQEYFVGPYEVNSTHPSRREPAMKTTRACVSCHGQPWSTCQKQVQSLELSPMKTKAVCQGCHMPVRDAKLVQWINFDALPTRKVASHAFPGVHDPNTLRSAIAVETEVVEGRVVIGLVNRGSGHQVPASPWRKLIALVQVFDATGREIYRKRDGFFQERSNAIAPGERANISFNKRANHASVKVTLYYRFYPNQPDLDADKIAERSFAL